MCSGRLLFHILWIQNAETVEKLRKDCRRKATSVTKKSMRTISIIALVATVSLLTQASLLLYGSFSRNETSLNASAVTFYILELVPVIMFMILFSPNIKKKREKNNILSPTSTSRSTGTSEKMHKEQKYKQSNKKVP